MPQNMQRQQSVSQDRTVPLSKDLMYAALREFPGYDKQTALTLYLINQTEKQQKTDSEQTRLIQSQKTQNDKLTGAIKDIGQELVDLEQQSKDTDIELERLKDLSARLKPAGEIQKQEAQISSEELKKLEQQLQALKTQPGMNPEKYAMLVKQVEELKSKKSVDTNDVEKIQKVLASLETKDSLNNDMFNKAMNQLEKTQKDLDAKEERFKGYIEKKGRESEERTKASAVELKKYAEIVDQYKSKLDQADQDLSSLAQDVAKFDNEITDAKKDLSLWKVRELNKTRAENEATIKQTKGDLTAFIIDQMKEIEKRLQQTKTLGSVGPTPQTSIPGAEPTGEPTPQPSQGSKVVDFRKRAMAQKISKMQDQSAERMVNEAVIRTARNYPENPDFDYWLRLNLPYMVSEFKDKFYDILERKDPTYGDQQIAYVLEDYSEWLWNRDPMTDADVEKFLDASLGKLLSQPVDIESQDELNFKESLDKVYENILDRIISKTLNKP